MISLFLGLTLLQEVPGQGIPPVYTEPACERPGSTLDRCKDVIPEPPRPITAPRPLFAPGTLVTLADYPAAALELGQSGTVIMRLTVSPDGGVSRCEIVRTTGFALLDQATCDLVAARAHFDPSQDDAGRATQAFAMLPVTWRIEE